MTLLQYWNMSNSKLPEKKEVNYSFCTDIRENILRTFLESMTLLTII